MPDPCRIVIEGIHAGPPYVGGGPLAATVVARSSDHCPQVRVTVRATGPGSPVLADQTVAVDFAQPATGPDFLPGLVTLGFALPPVGLRCGDMLHVEVRCSQDPSCAAGGSFAIACKPPPETGMPGGDGGWWPPMRCLFTAAAAAMALLAALAAIAVGIGTQLPALLATGLGLVAVAAVAWALWVQWCGPSLCTRLAVLCWVLKRGFIAALPVLAFSTSAGIVLVAIGYGALAGILVHALRARNCPVPSARLPLTQIPI